MAGVAATEPATRKATRKASLEHHSCQTNLMSPIQLYFLAVACVFQYTTLLFPFARLLFLKV
jgi:hypothetical protein